MLDNELTLAVSLARGAGKVILDHYSMEIVAEQKLGVDNFYEPVTAADREASRTIVEGIAAEFPDDAVLSEEEEDDAERRLSAKRAWIIDPLDGTAGYVEKNGDFAVQIGLVEAGNPILGVVYLPVPNILFYATAGGGSFAVTPDQEPRRLQVSDTVEFSRMNMAVSRHHRSPKMSVIADTFRVRQEIRRGSVGLKVGLIAEQACDMYIHLSPRSKLWDTCAPQIVLEEAGGRLTDLFGSPIKYDVRDLQNHNGILATNGAAHDRAVETLAPILSEFERAPFKAHA